MASRAEQKQQARARRIAAEEAERTAARRRSSIMRLGLVLGLAVIVVVVAIVVSSGGSDKTASNGGPTPGDGAAATALFRGIPQKGITLGSGGASTPTLIEFADLQCPFCREFDEGTMPSVVKRYVRTGKVNYELRVRSFLGPDSVRAAGAAAAAARQNKLYPFVDLFYHRQKEENTGYVTDDFIRGVASAVGVDASKAVAAANNPKSQPLVAQAETKASSLGSNGTPDFYLRLKSGRLVTVTHSVLPSGQFAKALDQALAQARGV